MNATSPNKCVALNILDRRLIVLDAKLELSLWMNLNKEIITMQPDVIIKIRNDYALVCFVTARDAGLMCARECKLLGNA